MSGRCRGADSDDDFDAVSDAPPCITRPCPAHDRAGLGGLSHGSEGRQCQGQDKTAGVRRLRAKAACVGRRLVIEWAPCYWV